MYVCMYVCIYVCMYMYVRKNPQSVKEHHISPPSCSTVLYYHGASPPCAAAMLLPLCLSLRCCAALFAYVVVLH
jgi:hypothetical protein